MTAFLVVLALACAVSLGLLLSYRRRFHLAVRRDMGFRIPTIDLGELDPRFEPGPFGVSLASEVTVLPAVGKVVGGTDEREAWILAALAKDARCMFEFGTAGGRTTYVWARNAPDDAVIGTITLRPEEVEEYRPSPTDRRTPTYHARDESRFDAFVYTGTDVEHKVRQYFGDSKEFDEGDWVGRCDLVFVDGSHAYSYVASDSEKALRMVRPGGVVLWHDYRGDREGKDVRAYLDELGERLPLARLARTRMVAYRAPEEGPEPGPHAAGAEEPDGARS